MTSPLLSSSTIAPVTGAPIARARRRGFSLIEVMAASSFLIVGLVGVISAIVAYQRMAATERHMTQGIHVAEGTMEELLLAYPSDSSLAVGSHGPNHYDDTGKRVASGGRYLAYWDVTASTPVEGMRRVNVRVQWTEATGAKKVEFFTYRR